MKKIILFIALLMTSFASTALNLKLYEPWRLLLEDNEKIYTVQNIIKTDSDFRVTTLDDTLIFNSEPNLRCNQAIIVNSETGNYDQLYRNEDIANMLLILGGIFVLIWILSILLVILCKK